MPQSKVRARRIAERAGAVPPRVQDRLNRWRAQHRGREPHHKRSLDIPAEIHEAQLVGDDGADFGKRPRQVRRSLADDTLVDAALPADDAIAVMRRRMRLARL